MEYNLILIAFVSGYIVYSAYFSWKLWKSKYLDKQKKILNTIFIWLIPFLWALVVKVIITPPNMETMTKSKRKSKGGKNSDNWQSLTGFGG